MAGIGVVATCSTGLSEGRVGTAIATSSAGCVGLSMGSGTFTFAPERSRTLDIAGGGVFSVTSDGAGFISGTGLRAACGEGRGRSAFETRSAVGSGGGDGFEVNFGLVVILVAGTGADFATTGAGVSTTGCGVISTCFDAVIVALSAGIAELDVGSG